MKGRIILPVLKQKISAQSYNYLSAIASEGCLFLNGRLLAHPELDTDIPLQGEDEFFIHDDQFVAARVTGKTSRGIKPEEALDTHMVAIKDLLVHTFAPATKLIKA